MLKTKQYFIFSTVMYIYAIQLWEKDKKETQEELFV